MNIIFNPLSNNALTESQLKNNDDIIFDLPGNNIFAKGVKFYGTDTHVEVLDVLDSKRTDAALSANMGRNLYLNKVPYNNQTREPKPSSKFETIICPTNESRQGDVPTNNGLLFRTNTGSIADLWISSDDNYIYKRYNNGIWQKIGAGYADSINWDDIINPPSTLPNPESLIIFDVSYDGSKQITITPNNYIYKVAKADIETNHITDSMAFIGTYYEPSNSVESVNNTPLRYSTKDIWNSWLEPKIENWYEKQSSKVNATLWGNQFTGTETISGSLHLSDGSQIYINNTKILNYQNNVLYVGFGTKDFREHYTYIYGGEDITLLTQNIKRFKITTSDISMYLPVYAKNTMNVTNGLYLSSHIIGKLNNTIQSYTDPWQASNADFRFGGSLAATKIYASQGFYHPNYDSTSGEIYLLTANGGITTVNNIRSAIYVRQNDDWDESYPLIWADEANTSSQYNTFLYKSYDKLTFNPSTSSLTVGSSTIPTSHRWIDGMTKAAVNTYSNGYRAWISGSTSSGRLSIGSFGDSTSDGNIYFSYAAEKDIIAGTNNVTSHICINPKTSIIRSDYYTGNSYTATGGYHLLQRNGSDVVAGVLTTDGYYYQTTNTTYYGSHPWGCIPVINGDSGVMEIGKYIDFHNDNGGKYDYSTRLLSTGDHQNTLNLPSKSGTLALTSDIPTVTNYYWANVKISTSANTQTQPSVNTIYANNWFRSQGDSGWYNESYGGGIWMNDSNWIRTYGGKSFYCDNQIYSSSTIRTDSQNQAIVLSNNSSPSWISALEGQIIFNTSKPIRFGGTSWDWNNWAGLKYTYSNKTIYLGIADGSIFNSNSAQSGGTLNLRAGISNIDLNSGTSIRGLTDGAPYNSSITLRDTSISLSAYGDISMSTGPGNIKLTSGYGAYANISSNFKIESSQGVYLNSGNSGNVYLCYGGGKVGIGTMSPSYKLDVAGDIYSSGTINCNALNVGGTLNIKDSVIDCSANNISIKSKKSGSLMIDGQEIIHYDSNTINFLKKAYFGQGLCIETIDTRIGNNITTDDTSALIDVIGYNTFNFTFKRAQNGQLLFLKLQKGGSNVKIYCTTQYCSVVKAMDFETHLNRNITKEIFGDGKARIFIYQSVHERWYEFYCG